MDELQQHEISLDEILNAVLEVLPDISHQLIDVLQYFFEMNYDIKNTLLNCMGDIFANPYYIFCFLMFSSQKYNRQNDEEYILALIALRKFDYKISQPHFTVPLTTLLEDKLLLKLRYPNMNVRMEAAKTCAYVVSTSDEAYSDIVSLVVDHLLILANTDLESEVRVAVLKALNETLNDVLSITDHVKSIQNLLQAEHVAVRKQGLLLLGRLSSYNPSYILPILRQYVLQIVKEIEYGIDIKVLKDYSILIIRIWLRLLACWES